MAKVLHRVPTIHMVFLGDLKILTSLKEQLEKEIRNIKVKKLHVFYV